MTTDITTPPLAVLLAEPPPVRTAEFQARMSELRAQLEREGAHWKGDAKWWGYVLELNQKAVDTTLEIRELLWDILSDFLPDAIAWPVSAMMFAHKIWIQEVSGGWGCKLTATWLMPLWPVPSSLGPVEDPFLWWSVYEPGQTWSADEKFASHISAANPALAEYRDRLYCVYRGYGDAHLWWTTYDPDTGWNDDSTLPGAPQSRNGPALATYRDKLYCVHRGADQWLWCTVYNGSTWTTDTRLPGNPETGTGPALAVYRDRLYCVYRGAGDHSLWYASFDGSSWSGHRKLDGAPESLTNPALAVYQDRLYCVHRGYGDATLWYTAFDGTRWSTDRKITGAPQSADGPALVVFDNKLFCVKRGHGDETLWWLSFDGSNWSSTRSFPYGNQSAAGPALSTYRDKHGTRDQIMCVHRGHGASRSGDAERDAAEAAIVAEEDAWKLTDPALPRQD
ncbi:hypothetical protein [Nocardia sp. NPDC057227]|uniref:hypothetical protein n=1 Tax=Nocardia sp. NPDC057227 TaxID=3346056 RepID=UPI003630E73C